jgi:chromate transporter
MNQVDPLQDSAKDGAKEKIDQEKPANAWLVFLLFLRLGLTSFGGPVAHLSYFRNEFVNRRSWLSERSYADLVALCQFLPGPASSQVGMALGMIRAGYAGALAAWAGFTLPSALLLTVFALGLSTWGGIVPDGMLHGLKIVAVAVVTQAVWGMAKTLCRSTGRIVLMVVSAGVVLQWSTAFGQIAVILVAAVTGMIFFKSPQQLMHDPPPIPTNRKVGLTLIAVFFGLLIGLPVLINAWPSHDLEVFNAFYRAGSLVFGGGHVVLPLLRSSVVPNGWVSNDAFLAGYGLTQAVPGPLFTYSAFLGASMNGWVGALICLVAIFLPSFLLVFGALPFWEQLRRSQTTQAASSGINASVVGLLLAALYHPVWTSAILKPTDFGFAVLALAALVFWKLPPWLVVLISVVAGLILGILVNLQ